jgi:hypothetical protein
VIRSFSLPWARRTLTVPGKGQTRGVVGSQSKQYKPLDFPCGWVWSARTLQSSNTDPRALQMGAWRRLQRRLRCLRCPQCLLALAGMVHPVSRKTRRDGVLGHWHGEGSLESRSAIEIPTADRVPDRPIHSQTARSQSQSPTRKNPATQRGHLPIFFASR